MPPRILQPLNPRDFDFWKARHLLNRAGFGGTPAQVAALASMGLKDAVAYIVNYQDIGDPAVAADTFDADIMSPATAEERQEVQRARRAGDEAVLERLRMERQQRQRQDRQQMGRIQEWWLQKMIESPRPLEEKLTLFWHGHFATGYRSIEDSYHMFRQNQLFRAHATGSFRELTLGVIRDPAMIRYLNNDQNNRRAPNENLARELMELFTLGEGHDYTEDDIKQGARALTGYGFQDDAFVFRQRLHDPELKTILGRTGNWDGDDFVSIILTRPVAGEFICFKLYRYFVNDRRPAPPEAGQRFVIELAKLFREQDYQLRPVLETLFMSEHFYADANAGAVIKSPLQLIVQAVRSLLTPARSVRDLLGACDLMGQNLFQPPNVKGWEGGESWINTSSLFIRQNVLIYLLTGHSPQAMPWQTAPGDYDALHLLESLRDDQGAVDPEAAIDYLLRFNLGGAIHPQRAETLRAFITQRDGAIDNAALIALLSLITAMPEYQLS
jgi:uncharacterized protein (DUF1800 family)